MEDNFNTVDVINHYWVMKQTGRPNKYDLLKIYSIFALKFSLLFLACDAKFRYADFCNTDERASVIDLDGLCRSYKK
jgi:hypothetical protein